MPYYRTTYYSGDVYEVEEYFSPRERGKRIPRGRNENLSTQQQMERNEINARKKLARLVNTNFGKGDLFVTLTYAEEPGEEEAQREMANFIRRVRRHRRKKGAPELRYVGVTEAEDHRVHHHIIMSAMSIDELISLWTKGRCIVSMLEPGGDYTGLANYITKGKAKHKKKRWSQSRNLKKPRVRVKKITRASGPLKAPKGYKIIQQQYYVSDATGCTQYLRAIRVGGADYGIGMDGEKEGKRSA